MYIKETGTKLRGFVFLFSFWKGEEKDIFIMKIIEQLSLYRSYENSVRSVRDFQKIKKARE